MLNYFFFVADKYLSALLRFQKSPESIYLATAHPSCGCSLGGLVVFRNDGMKMPLGAEIFAVQNFKEIRFSCALCQTTATTRCVGWKKHQAVASWWGSNWNSTNALWCFNESGNSYLRWEGDECRAFKWISRNVWRLHGKPCAGAELDTNFCLYSLIINQYDYRCSKVNDVILFLKQ